ncbi:hypothetical protein ASPTUDRAFT_48097 [Aspergillus tubingensis CBS 134.48]|uniref:Secreted protein n=1 Tax=Aspergillus tubingensis (strain CBS 134.48) TaxID=767770 RepID=A0A1L9MQX2_ASPTC|nr:hypothetical protein ASPTUDRAFT_48097 [Aspergillus tubingensis CBS 134.48]
MLTFVLGFSFCSLSIFRQLIGMIQSMHQSNTPHSSEATYPGSGYQNTGLDGGKRHRREKLKYRPRVDPVGLGFPASKFPVAGQRFH